MNAGQAEQLRLRQTISLIVDGAAAREKALREDFDARINASEARERRAEDGARRAEETARDALAQLDEAKAKLREALAPSKATKRAKKR